MDTVRILMVIKCCTRLPDVGGAHETVEIIAENLKIIPEYILLIQRVSACCRTPFVCSS